MKSTDARQQWTEFQRLDDRFNEDPSIENYVTLRRSFPGGDTTIYQLAEVDPREAKAFELDLERARLTHTLVRGALSGDERDIDELCLQLMERLIERRVLQGKGETHLQSRGKSVSDALIGHLIVAMLEVLQQDDLSPRSSLVVLVREQLVGTTNEVFKSHTKWKGRNQALFLGMRMKRQGVEPTIRKVATALNVQPSTVSRWFPEGDFVQQIEEFGRRLKKFRSNRS
jgi:hypothetical protein